MKKYFLISVGAALVGLGVAGCGRQPAKGPQAGTIRRPTAIDPLAWVLAPHQGEGRLDVEIRHGQAQLRAGTHPEIDLERLGWLFVAKARESFDPGFYRLVEQCALGLDSRRPGCPEGLLLRGHALQNQHRFKEAEPIARQLAASRGAPFDFGLLGDVLMEQGQLAEATRAYQTMIDLRPDLHSYARGAQIRWLKGDLPGAVELMESAAAASSPLDPEPAAWVRTRLASYRLQTGARAEADRACDEALDLQKDYPPALLLKGRIRLAAGDGAEAVDLLKTAAERNPLPEYQWALADALRQQNQVEQAETVEADLARAGAAKDPRTYSLYLSTRGGSAAAALALAQNELNDRGDVFTHDALAWALCAADRTNEAETEMQKALREETRDPRLFFHAAVIAGKAGRPEQARRWFDLAVHSMDLLLPSEQAQLLAATPGISRGSTLEPAVGGARTDLSTDGN